MIAHNSETHRIQQAFRQVMDACAKPGTIHQLPLDHDATPATGLDASLETLTKIFVDQATSFTCCAPKPQQDAITRAIRQETRAKAFTQDDESKPAFVIIPSFAADADVARAIKGACAGTLLSPEAGATAFISVEALCAEASAEAPFGFVLEGPGIKGTHTFCASSNTWALAREERHDEYPCGIEIILVTQTGTMVCIPRSTHVRANAQTSAINAKKEGDE